VRLRPRPPRQPPRRPGSVPQSRPRRRQPEHPRQMGAGGGSAAERRDRPGWTQYTHEHVPISFCQYSETLPLTDFGAPAPKHASGGVKAHLCHGEYASWGQMKDVGPARSPFQGDLGRWCRPTGSDADAATRQTPLLTLILQCMYLNVCVCICMY
jgi:hypothetical protein